MEWVDPPSFAIKISVVHVDPREGFGDPAYDYIDNLSRGWGLISYRDFSDLHLTEVLPRPMGGSRTINSVVLGERVQVPPELSGLSGFPGPPPADINWGCIGLSDHSEQHTWRYAGWVSDGTAPVEEFVYGSLAAAISAIDKAAIANRDESNHPSAVAQARGVRAEPVEVGVQEQWGEEFER